MEMVGLNDVFGESGEPEQLLKHFSIKAENICSAVKNALKRKKSGCVKTKC